MSTTEESLLAEMKCKFPGMEHYWISQHYQSTEKVKRLQHDCDGTFSKMVRNQHKEHGGFVYCGMLDSFSEPIQGRVFRSVTLSGLMRLIVAENPEYTPEESPQVKRRFKI